MSGDLIFFIGRNRDCPDELGSVWREVKFPVRAGVNASTGIP